MWFVAFGLNVLFFLGAKMYLVCEADKLINLSKVFLWISWTSQWAALFLSALMALQTLAGAHKRKQD